IAMAFEVDRGVLPRGRRGVIADEIVGDHIAQCRKAFDAVAAVAKNNIADDSVVGVGFAQVTDAAAGVLREYIVADHGVPDPLAEEKAVTAVAVADIIAPNAFGDTRAGMVAVPDAVFDQTVGNSGRAL